jgi:tRNA threonylcarbamoyladenosine modification (KEOPS) complex  Pcc1 subunit
MKINCKIKIQYPNKKITETIVQSLKVDDISFVQSIIKNETELNVNITAKTISSLLHTLDDYLACLTVAEKIVNKN